MMSTYLKVGLVYDANYRPNQPKTVTNQTVGLVAHLLDGP